MMKSINMLLLASATSVSCAAAAQNVPDGFCKSFNLTFDDTPGVAEPEVRGVILTNDFYESVGIANITCVRANRNPSNSVCRLFDTSEPVGRWNDSCAGFGCVCACEPHVCSPLNKCGDPDLFSTSLGNILIIEERSARRAPAFPPDDNAKGGNVLIAFEAPTSVISIGFMDFDENTPAIMEFRHANGATQIVGPVTGNNGHVVIPIMVDDVQNMTITMLGSGAISSLQYSQHCTASSGGDPHIAVFNAPRRQSFHGECDLVLVQSPIMDLHVRTTIAKYYSYIAAAAVKIGGRTLEISAGNSTAVRLDGRVHSMDDSKLLSFSSVYKNATYKYYQMETQRPTNCKSYVLEVTPWVFVRVKMHAEFLTVSVHGDDDLQGAVGLLGRFPDGALVVRNGKVSTVPFVDFAIEWQVNPGDPILFDDLRPPQLPYERCRLPTDPRPSRRLLRSTTSGLFRQALEACRQVAYSPQDIDLCVDDILTTGDVELAAIW